MINSPKYACIAGNEARSEPAGGGFEIETATPNEQRDKQMRAGCLLNNSFVQVGFQKQISENQLQQFPPFYDCPRRNLEYSRRH